MKNWFIRSTILMVFYFCFHSLTAQQVVQGEYFWDADPGQGNGIPVSAVDGNFDEALEEVFSNSLTMPSAGLHIFNLRIQGADGGWSNVFSYTINVSNGSLSTRTINVVQAEYFWDVDPGQGSGTPILALDGSLDEALETLFDSNVSIPAGTGVHKFGIRIKGVDGGWSSPFYYVVNITNGTLTTRTTNVVQAEYFWDFDPGQGNGAAILAMDGNLDEALEQLFDSNVSMPAGVGIHKFGIRLKGVDGTWSNVFHYIVNVSDQTLVTRSPKVSQAEYYWNTDPGQGNGIPILAEDGNFDEALEEVFSGSLIGVGSGVHLFHLRVKDENNQWSNPFRHVIEVTYADTYATIDTSLCTFGGSYVVPSGDESYTSSGTYMDTIPNAIGMDSILTINLTFGTNTSSTINPFACGSYLSPAGSTYTSSGTYTEVIPNSVGCDSTITINLTVGTPTSSTLSVSACDTYTAPSGIVYSNSGTYTDVITNMAGCDSTITINLSISNSSTATINETLCSSSYTSANGNTYTSSGTYTEVISNSVGCDSTITINLNLLSPSTSTLNESVCGTYTSPAGNTYTTSGTYTDVIPNAQGCDSTITINLTVGVPTSSSIVDTACDSYASPAGNIYTTSGTYTDVIPNAQGCDSTITINLSILSSTSSSITETACDSYTWLTNGNTYTSSGSYVTTLTNSMGCDSTITLNLTINSANTTVTQAGSTLIANQSGAIYQWVSCPSMNAIAGETNQSFTATSNGDYAVIVIENGCSSTSSCYTVTGLGVLSETFLPIEVYPNPTIDGLVTLKLPESGLNVEIKVLTLDGRITSFQKLDKAGEVTSVVLPEADGLYFIEVQIGEEVFVQKIQRL